MMRHTQERKALVEDYRKRHAAECAGYNDHHVEGLVFALGDVSTEALVHQLHQRGYAVVLEVGGMKLLRELWHWLNHARCAMCGLVEVLYVGVFPFTHRRVCIYCRDCAPEFYDDAG
jgi:hypothetical protein